MTDRQENFLSMCKTLQITCNSHAGSWAGLPAFGNTYSEFNTLVSELDAAKQIQETDITGIAVDKKVKRDKLIDLAVRIGGNIKSYAVKINDNFLKEKVDYSKSDMINSRDEMLVSRCQIIHDEGLANEGNLADYNITKELLLELQALIGEYSLFSQMPSAKKDIRESATEMIVTIIQNIRKILIQLDGLANFLKVDHSGFYNDYKKSRAIYDLGKGKKEEPSSPEPVEE